MSENQPLVSVIIPFYNPSPQFFQEATGSVFSQTYPNWELLLVDDGSEEGWEEIPGKLAASYGGPGAERVRVCQHPGGQNRGISASRQLGVENARGKYVAFLDADDLWLSDKLDEQVAILEKHPEAAMVYGNTLYWFSWTGDPVDARRDFQPKPGLIRPGIVYPPKLLPLYLMGKTFVPCTCSILIQREAVERVGGFEDNFRGMYEDQVFYAKMALAAPVYVSERCWDLYRQHGSSISAVTASQGINREVRQHFLNWLETYLEDNQVRDAEVWQAVRREQWLLQDSSTAHRSEENRMRIRRAKKWLLKLQDGVLPVPIRQRIWGRNRSCK